MSVNPRHRRTQSDSAGAWDLQAPAYDVSNWQPNAQDDFFNLGCMELGSILEPEQEGVHADLLPDEMTEDHGAGGWEEDSHGGDVDQHPMGLQRSASFPKVNLSQEGSRSRKDRQQKAAADSSKGDDSLMLLDPKRAKRILANRESAAKSKDRKLKYSSQLQEESSVIAELRAGHQARAAEITEQHALLERYISDMASKARELNKLVQAADSDNAALKSKLLSMQAALGMANQEVFLDTTPVVFTIPEPPAFRPGKPVEASSCGVGTVSTVEGLAELQSSPQQQKVLPGHIQDSGHPRMMDDHPQQLRQEQQQPQPQHLGSLYLDGSCTAGAMGRGPWNEIKREVLEVPAVGSTHRRSTEASIQNLGIPSVHSHKDPMMNPFAHINPADAPYVSYKPQSRQQPWEQSGSTSCGGVVMGSFGRPPSNSAAALPFSSQMQITPCPGGIPSVLQLPGSTTRQASGAARLRAGFSSHMDTGHAVPEESPLLDGVPSLSSLLPPILQEAFNSDLLSPCSLSSIDLDLPSDLDMFLPHNPSS